MNYIDFRDMRQDPSFSDGLDFGAEPVSESIKAAGIVAASNFLTSIYAHDDHLLVRLIETWIELGKKKSRVDNRNSCYILCQPDELQPRLGRIWDVAQTNRLNVFFGVCPRFGVNGEFDLAWQIKTVRTLWADIDNVSVAEALIRIEKARLPQPSIVVNSGNGVHVYWLLEEPYLIDDMGDPPPVLTEWVKDSKKKKLSKYVILNGERVALANDKLQLGAKAIAIQATLAGIANSIGGDHTNDLARLLRIPGSLNRKDERNGKRPIPTELVVCDRSIRYPISVFEKFRTPLGEPVRPRTIRMPSRTIASRGSLEELISAAANAEIGRRSEADFAVCCEALRTGISKEDLWGRVADFGKFKEGGPRYFETTWGNAQTKVAAERQSIARDASEFESSAAARSVIVVNSTITPVGNTLQEISGVLAMAGNCFIRSDQLIVINDSNIQPVTRAVELIGLLSQDVEFIYCVGDSRSFKPLQTNLANTWLHNSNERQRLRTINLFVRNQVYSTDWRLVPPRYDESSGIYYAGESIMPVDSTTHLNRLLGEFCFKTPGDRTNYIGMLLTAVLMPHFIGSKPAALLCANQPGLGKTILAQIIAALRDGGAAETVTYNPNDEEFEKRLGSVVRRGATTIIIDNAKSRGRNARIDSPCLERSISDPILSFRLLGHSDTIRVENSHIFCITANSPEVSRDLITRSIIINLHYEGDPARRNFTIDDPEGFALQYRLQILAELLGLVDRWIKAGKLMVKTHSRFNKRHWGNIIGGILANAGEQDFLANADEAAAELDETDREFRELVALLAEQSKIEWTPAELARLCAEANLLREDLRDRSDHSQATRMGKIASRYVTQIFTLDDGRRVTFTRSGRRKGKVYGLSEENPAEP